MDASAGCTGISGTYDGTRSRSEAQPGSCPQDYSFNPILPLNVTADTTSASGYVLEVGYTDYDTGDLIFLSCVTNVAGCSLFATCAPSVGSDEVSITFEEDRFSGTMMRNDTTQGCTVNFDLSGERK